MFYVYLIESENYNQTYIGSTNDLRRRLKEHNSGLEVSTKKYKPWRLVCYEAYQSEQDARRREKKLKSHGNAVRQLKKRSRHSFKNGAGFTQAPFSSSNNGGSDDKQNGAGFTLTDVLIGTALLLIVFLGIFGAFRLGIQVVGHSRAKIKATALANQKLEEARNLPYKEVGIRGEDENGAIESPEYSTSTERYTITTDVNCVLSDKDGLTPEDSCPCDFKRVTVTVSWPGRFSGEVSLAADIAPKNNVQECEKTGGVLETAVFDAQGNPLSDIEVQVENINTGVKSYCLTDSNGECSGENAIFLDTSSESENYKITVPRPGTDTNYSTVETFKTGDVYNSKTIATPQKPNATILENQVTEMSFGIDKLSSFSIQTKSSRGKESFVDTFNNSDKISAYSNITVNEGEATLSATDSDYATSGYLVSIAISPSPLKEWNKLTRKESTTANTEVNYQLLYYDATSSDWVLIPDSDLTGNSTGLEPPVDLSNLDCSTYDSLKIKGTLSTSDSSKTPSLLEWQLSYLTRVAYPLTGVTFVLRGNKIVGIDASEEPIYKYSKEHSIDRSGTISNLEWDTYNFSSFQVNGKDTDLEEGVPGEKLGNGSLSVGLSPNIDQDLTLYFATENSLLVKVVDSDDSSPVFGAQVNLSNSSLGYDQIQQTDQEGKTFFAPLEEATYDLDVSADGYNSASTQVYVSGDATTTVSLKLSPS